MTNKQTKKCKEEEFEAKERNGQKVEVKTFGTLENVKNRTKQRNQS